MHELVGLGLATMIVFIGNKLSLGTWFSRTLSKRLRFGTFFVVLPFGLFGLSARTRYLAKSNGMNQRSTTSSCTPRWLGSEWSIMLRLALFWSKLFSKVSTKHGKLVMFFVGTTTWKSLGSAMHLGSLTNFFTSWHWCNCPWLVEWGVVLGWVQSLIYWNWLSSLSY